MNGYDGIYSCYILRVVLSTSIIVSTMATYSSSFSIRFSYFALSVLLIPVVGCDRFSVQKQLEKYVADQIESSPLPRKITDQQTLIEVRAGELELIQVITIKGPKGQLKENRDQIEQDVKTELQKKKNQIKNLIDFKIVMTFKYLHEPSKEVLHEFQIKPWSDL